MARPKGSKNVSLDHQINAIAQKIRERVGSLKQEIELRQQEVDRLSNQYALLTGSGGGSVVARGRGRPVGSGGMRRGKRIRRLGVNVEWIGGQLSRQPMTLKQLQDVALREGRSALSVMNVLRANQNKFKSSEGKKDPSKRGRAAHVWSAK